MTVLSEYEEERRAKIERNKAMLESLGIEAKQDAKPQKNAWTKKVVDGPVRRSTRAPVERTRFGYDEAPSEKFGQRQSKRVKMLRQKPATYSIAFPPPRTTSLMERNQIVTTPKNVGLDMAETARKQQSLKVSYAMTNRMGHEYTDAQPYSVILDGVPPHTIVTEPTITGKSCKELTLVVPSDSYVGHALYPVGKLATMMWLCPGYHPRFSLLQSHQVWTNAMVIFINVDLNDRYTNTFERENNSLFVYWFARSSLAEDHPVLQQLLLGPRSNAAPATDNDTSLQRHDKPCLLFFRFAQGPYIYGGQLGYVRHDAEGYPSIRFKFELLNAALFGEPLNALLDRINSENERK
ncbi:hypothetical protein, variant 1 [Aphanomyces invadans]|uniref:Uncharacterized protein n=1 Tax=Aphanomyces invadans TaxID=157072 RepID=A0A024UV73_9STRA|nr:hypothetical protein, variant 1 [Aphanomyces invadans]ETW09855.1 hypothetical protein, variant 1 [Aphanomyces invadans]|eukprot:XP_008861266.1 hypothetical protein, variant 1 [Aphanomyces invadans]